ncbi:MAG: TauD/TfdA family dioxygenase [Betaproteobacteria bacterium]|nr:TauD/TfdA family dioxygenase [Betaproteobacteria bacterium]
MSYTTFEARPLSGYIGAYITGANLKDEHNARMWDELNQAILEYKVIAIRGQRLSPGEHMAAVKHFGAPCFYPFAKGLADFPQMTPIIKESHEREAFGNDWHSDTPYLAEPPAYTTLYAIDTPLRGGDTLYCNTQAAYEELSPGAKKLINGVIGVFSAGLKHGRGGDRAAHFSKITTMPVTNSEHADRYESKHPIVRTHPQTGKKALYVSALHTLRLDEMTERESRPLINMLNDHQITPEFCCRVQWEPGQLTIWDNRCTMHHAVNDYHGNRREMLRLTARPEKPT